MNHVASRPPILRSQAEALEAIHALLPMLRERAPQTDSERGARPETIRAISDAGLFGLLTPRHFGGSELGLETLVKVTSAISSVCGSSAWLFGVLAGHSWLLNLFPVETQQEVYANPHALASTIFRLGGEVRRVRDGYMLENAEGRFCSGIDHADWIIVGNAVINPDGPPEPRFFLLPRSAIATVIDDWDVAGMRGTASKTIRLHDSFIPEHRSVRLEDMGRGTTPGAEFHNKPLYRMPWSYVCPFSLVGVPIGLARAAISCFGGLLNRQMANFSSEQIAEQSATFARLGIAAADVDAAAASVLENARRMDAAPSPDAVSPLEFARIPRDWAYAAQKSRQAVTSLFEAAGGSATYNGAEMQRIWRDVNCAANHYAFTWDSALTAYGRGVAGVAPPRFGAKGRA